MTWLRVLASRLVGWVRRNRLDEEFDEEVRFHTPDGNGRQR